MIEVNLLPWRQEQVARRRKEKFFILVATGICALAFMLPVVLMTNSRVNESSQLNGYLQSRINTLDESLNEVRNLESSKAELIGQIQIHNFRLLHLCTKNAGLKTVDIVSCTVFRYNQT